MTASVRRLDRRSTTLALLAVAAAAIAVGAVAYPPIADDQGNDQASRPAQPVDAPLRCRQADRASVAQLVALLERNRPGDEPILELAVHTLNTARRHCLYDWDGRGLADYQWLGRWLGGQD